MVDKIPPNARTVTASSTAEGPMMSDQPTPHAGDRRMTHPRSRRRRGGGILIVTIVVAAVAFSAYAIHQFYRSWTKPLPDIDSCYDNRGLHLRSDSDPQVWSTCIAEQAKRFLAADYAEAKDLGKAFLTLLIAVFVGSITFSEKIVDFQRSGWWPRGLMITCWSAVLLAIVACGLGLAFFVTAAGMATYEPQLMYQQLEIQAVKAFIVAGAAFGCGLVALLAAGIVALVDRNSAVAGNASAA